MDRLAWRTAKAQLYLLEAAYVKDAVGRDRIRRNKDTLRELRCLQEILGDLHAGEFGRAPERRRKAAESATSTWAALCSAVAKHGGGRTPEEHCEVPRSVKRFLLALPDAGGPSSPLRGRCGSESGAATSTRAPSEAAAASIEPDGRSNATESHLSDTAFLSEVAATAMALRPGGGQRLCCEQLDRLAAELREQLDQEYTSLLSSIEEVQGLMEAEVNDVELLPPLEVLEAFALSAEAARRSLELAARHSSSATGPKQLTICVGDELSDTKGSKSSAWRTPSSPSSHGTAARQERVILGKSSEAAPEVAEVEEPPLKVALLVEAPSEKPPLEKTTIEKPVVESELPLETSLKEPLPGKSEAKKLPVEEALPEDASLKDPPLEESQLAEELLLKDVRVVESPLKEIPSRTATDRSRLLEEALREQSPLEESEMDDAPVKELPLKEVSVRGNPARRGKIRKAQLLEALLDRPLLELPSSEKAPLEEILEEALLEPPGEPLPSEPGLDAEVLLQDVALACAEAAAPVDLHTPFTLAAPGEAPEVACMVSPSSPDEPISATDAVSGSDNSACGSAAACNAAVQAPAARPRWADLSDDEEITFPLSPARRAPRMPLEAKLPACLPDAADDSNGVQGPGKAMCGQCREWLGKDSFSRRAWRQARGLGGASVAGGTEKSGALCRTCAPAA